MHTLSEEEDRHFFEYMQELKNYKSEKGKTTRVSQFESGRYKKGSLKQRLFEPLAGASRDANGTLVFEFTDSDLIFGLN